MYVMCRTTISLILSCLFKFFYFKEHNIVLNVILECVWARSVHYYINIGCGFQRACSVCVCASRVHGVSKRKLLKCYRLQILYLIRYSP